MDSTYQANTQVIAETLKRNWGYESLLPLQAEAIDAILAGRDSLTVLPTGGGKSLCYQLPAVCLPGLAIVVSPLIALMKDQVDALLEVGIPAAAVNSTQGAYERRRTAERIRAGQLKLLYLAPERLLAEKTLEFLASQQISLIAIDEAHCISSWGHDFRPEYRELKRLRAALPNVAMHAFTATATVQVRQDIIDELRLHEPRVLVGDFRRPNLVYKVTRRDSGLKQICRVLDRYRGQSGIIYCISRAEVEKTSSLLNELGYCTLPYHAGLTDQQRVEYQEAFLHDRCETIVATIAFGMGIDKSNVRYVIHSGMPRSIEHYQQESGRAGRDGLQAECWLLHAPRDLMTWQFVIGDEDSEANRAARNSLERISQFCASVECRHRRLVEYFGQQLDEACGACDICLGELTQVEDALTIAQKILSCVLRVQERFGIIHVAGVLQGSKRKQILRCGHDRLSTWGLLNEFQLSLIRDWIEQLVGQDVLVKVGEYQQLKLTDLGRLVLRGEYLPTLLQPNAAAGRRMEQESTPTALLESWDGVDRGLFEALRGLRQRVATEQHMPAYIIFSDASLRDMARRRPSSRDYFLDVHGVGAKKAEVYGPPFMECIVAYCQSHAVTLDCPTSPGMGSVQSVTADSDSHTEEFGNHTSSHTSASTLASAYKLFDAGLSIDQVARELCRAPSTTTDYLIDYISQRHISDPTQWVSDIEISRIELAARYAFLDSREQRLKPVHDALHSTIDYGQIRVVLACQANRDRSRE